MEGESSAVEYDFEEVEGEGSEDEGEDAKVEMQGEADEAEENEGEGEDAEEEATPAEPPQEPPSDPTQYYESYDYSNTEEPPVETLYSSEKYTYTQQDAEEYCSLVKDYFIQQGYDFEAWLQQQIASGVEPEWWWPPLPPQDPESQPGGDEALPPPLPEESVDYAPSKKPCKSPKPLMGMKSFKYLERKVLNSFMKETEEERMAKIKTRLGLMKKVPAPKSSSLNVLLLKGDFAQGAESKDEMNEMHLKQFTTTEWAVKNAVSFLTKAGCTSPPQSLTALKPNNTTERLKVFLQARKRRGGIGVTPPEITPALKRQAERAVWRYIIENSRPKYPLPRFILPRFRFLRKIEKELIGPGSYEHEPYEKYRKCKCGLSSFDSCTLRFKGEDDGERGGGGGGRGKDPYEKWEAALQRYRHPGKVPLFQSTPCNFRSTKCSSGSGLSPTHYNPSEPPRFKCLRGMYDQGSGFDAFCPEDKKRGEYGLEARRGPGLYNPQDNSLNDKYHYFKGKFSQTARHKQFGFRAAFNNPLWPVDKGDRPGPSTYDPYHMVEWTEATWVPFNIGEGLTGDKKIENRLLAPDFYFFKQEERRILGGGARSSFRSKTQQITPDLKHIGLRGRNAAVGWKWDQSGLDKNHEKC